MRKIQKTISLEPMTSRLPSILPAYKDNQLYYFDDISLKSRNYVYPSNYGMIPINVVVNKMPFSCTTTDYALVNCTATNEPQIIRIDDLEIEYEDTSEENSTSNRFVLSFERLSIWFYKFKEYYHLLNDYGHCGVVYTSAQEYYKNESKKYPQDMVYGTDENVYIELDEELSRMGACVSITEDCKGNPKQAVDNGFYKWICDNIIPMFTIPKEYQEYWHRTTLYYPDVINWIEWFEDRNGLYSTYTTIESCRTLAEKNIDGEDPCHYEEGNCCECKEYVNRGGIKMYNQLKAWYVNLQTNIENIKNIVSANTSCFTPTVISSINMQGNLHTNGEMSVICEQYELGVDYRTSEYSPISGFGITENISSGAVVVKDDKLMRLVSGGGYTYDDEYMEMVFDENAWESAYTFNSADTVVSGTTTSRLKSIHTSNYLVDDIGNSIYGIYKPDSGATNHQPPIYTELEPIYQIGKIANLTRIGTQNKFFGDCIDSMIFYYKTIDNEIDEKTMFSGSSEGSLSAITESTLEKERKESESALTYYDDIFCDITYHVGNVYAISGDKLSKDEGVEYTETVNFVKERVEYYLKKKDSIILPFEKNKIDSHSISYPIYVYTLKQLEERIDDNTYGVPYEDNIATFKAEFNRPYIDDYVSSVTLSGEFSGTTLSGDTCLPLFMEEYKLGTAAPQNVKGDIYIDRGINAAFEKHIKLGEVTTLEALTQYGLNFFRIMEK